MISGQEAAICDLKRKKDAEGFIIPLVQGAVSVWDSQNVNEILGYINRIVMPRTKR